MKKGYDARFRMAAVKGVLEKGFTIRKISEIFKVHYQTLRKWIKQYKETGEVVSTKVIKRKPYKLDWELLKQDVEKYPDLYLSERAEKLGVSIYAIWYALKKMGIKHKKRVLPIKSVMKKKGELIWNRSQI